MMWWNGNGSSGGWWLFGVLMAVICIVMMVRMMGHGMHGSHMGMGHGTHGSHTYESQGHRTGGGPEQILADRLATGEIDIEEYERRLAVLQRASNPG